MHFTYSKCNKADTGLLLSGVLLRVRIYTAPSTFAVRSIDDLEPLN